MGKENRAFQGMGRVGANSRGKNQRIIFGKHKPFSMPGLRKERVRRQICKER